MKELIKFQNEIKNWDIEKVLDEMMYIYRESKMNIREDLKKEYVNKTLLLKMEVVSRIK